MQGFITALRQLYFCVFVCQYLPASNLTLNLVCYTCLHLNSHPWLLQFLINIMNCDMQCLNFSLIDSQLTPISCCVVGLYKPNLKASHNINLYRWLYMNERLEVTVQLLHQSFDRKFISDYCLLIIVLIVRISYFVFHIIEY